MRFHDYYDLLTPPLLLPRIQLYKIATELKFSRDSTAGPPKNHFKYLTTDICEVGIL